MKRNLMNIAVASTIALLPLGALADDAYQGSWYALPGVSVMNADPDLQANHGDIGAFIRLGKEVSEHWDVQLGLSFDRAGENSGTYSNGQYKQTLLGVDALYLLSRDKFRPFVLAGLGLAQNSVDYGGNGVSARGDKTSWMGNVGFGAQYLFTDSLGVQADVRQVWSRVKADQVGGNGLNFSGTETGSNTYLNVGVIFKFGEPTQVAAAEPTPLPEPTPPAPVAAAEPAPVGPAEPAFEKVTLSSEVLFDFNKTTLKSEGKDRLNADVVQKMQAHPEVDIVLITGYTDRIGGEAYNQKLSERRAAQVKEYLISQGIAEGRLHTVGKGEADPVVDCQGARSKKVIECLQPNRRVVVEIEVQRAGN